MSAIRGRLLESVGESQSDSSVWLRTRQRLKRSPGAAGKNRLVSGCIDEARAITCKCSSVSTKRDAQPSASALQPKSFALQIQSSLRVQSRSHVKRKFAAVWGVALVDGCRSIAA